MTKELDAKNDAEKKSEERLGKAEKAYEKSEAKLSVEGVKMDYENNDLELLELVFR